MKGNNDMANLILYYSRKGENYWNGSIRNIEIGNTKRAAQYIQESIGGDLFEIETVKPYASDYYTCIEEAKQELHTNARPALKAYISDISRYDTIFIGYPNWWGTCPMAVFSLLEHLDLTGKKLIPFCTNEGSGMGSSEHDLQKLCQGAVFAKGLAIHGAEVESQKDIIMAWAKKQSKVS